MHACANGVSAHQGAQAICLAPILDLVVAAVQHSQGTQLLHPHLQAARCLALFLDADLWAGARSKRQGELVQAGNAIRYRRLQQLTGARLSRMPCADLGVLQALVHPNCRSLCGRAQLVGSSPSSDPSCLPNWGVPSMCTAMRPILHKRVHPKKHAACARSCSQGAPAGCRRSRAPLAFLPRCPGFQSS